MFGGMRLFVKSLHVPSLKLGDRARNDSAAILNRRGIRVGLYVGDVAQVRDLRWEAGFAVSSSFLVPFPLAIVHVHAIHDRWRMACRSFREWRPSLPSLRMPSV